MPVRPSGRWGRHGMAVAAVAAIVLVLLGTVAHAAVRPTSDEAARQLKHRSGRLRIKNSLGREAIVGKLGMTPGGRVGGTVKIGNASRYRARFYLGLARLVDVRGREGGRLSDRLVLTVKRVFPRRRPRLVYTGPLRKLSLVKLGRFRPREARTYHFSVLFPDGGMSGFDNRYLGAWTSLTFKWYARRAR